MKNNKFLIIINSLGKGGAERIASEFSFFLEEQGYDVIFLFTDIASISYKIPSTAKTVSLPFSKYVKTFLFPIIICIQAVYVRLYFGKHKNVISFLHRANLVNGLSSLFSGRKVIISERSIFSKSYKGSKQHLMKGILSLLFIRVTKIIAVSQVVKKELISSFNVKPSKIKVIHNPINTNDFNFEENKKEFYAIDKGINFCTVGRLISSKRIELVITLFYKILQFSPKSKLHILGDGDNVSILKKLAEDLNIKEQVVFYGNVSDVPLILKKCDIFLFTSLYESFGNVALEATSSGLPVIYSSNLDSVKEIYLNTNSLSFSIDENIDDNEVKSIIKFIELLEYESFKQERTKLLQRHRGEEIFKEYLNEYKK
ncbi:MAG: hypothetical protein COA67_11170 [Lutibacter sp.]|nr:MAG: hypothetical protein COA67_11170 [Lutibacter sp.]